MPSLAELTDYQDQPKRLYMNMSGSEGTPLLDNTPAVPISGDTNTLPQPDVVSQPEGKPLLDRIISRLAGAYGEERYQTWPEKLVRSGFSAAGDALNNQIPQYQVDPVTQDVHTSPQMIERAMDMSTVAGTGGMAGTTDATLGSAPFLRPALKYEGKIYKAPMKPDAQHLDALPAHLQDEFTRQAMSGEDISNFNFGFMNHKGQFLSREDALKYAIDQGLLDPHAAQYGALTSTLMADSSKPGTAIEAMAKAEPFYSALEHNVGQIKQGKMTGDQWLGTLSNKPGVKPEELQWTGLNDFLKERGSQPVTKQEVQSFVDANKVSLKEVNKADKVKIDPVVKFIHESLGPASKHITDAASIADARKFNAHFRETTKGMSDEEVLNAARQSEKLEGVGDTKYHSYQLPGGENYREMLLTLPEKARTAKDIAKEKGYPWDELTTKDIKQLEDQARTENNSSKYRSSHWDEPNILAHVRMNDRMIEGKKSLHLEEIQSDWHQQGRRVGYKSGEDFRNQFKEAHEKFNELETKLTAAKAEVAEYQKRVLNKLGVNSYTEILANPEAKAKFKTLQSEDKAYQDAIAKVKQISEEQNAINPALREAELAHKEDLKVPNAPFKSNWHELALKRMIREAAEQSHKSEVANWDKMVHSNTDELAHKLVASGHLKEICE